MYKRYTWRMLHPTAEGGQAAAETTDDKNQAVTGGEDDGAKEKDETQDKEAKSKDDSLTMSKKEYEDAIAKAERRAVRNARKELATDGEDEDDADDPVKQAEKKLQEANQRMLVATVKSLGSDKQITANGMKVAEKFLDLSNCMGEDGGVDEEAVNDELDAFLAAFPEFKKSEPKNPQYQYEGNPKNGGKAMSKDEIMKIRDPQKRRQAISDNIHLFN